MDAVVPGINTKMVVAISEITTVQTKWFGLGLGLVQMLLKTTVCLMLGDIINGWKQHTGGYLPEQFDCSKLLPLCHCLGNSFEALDYVTKGE